MASEQLTKIDTYNSNIAHANKITASGATNMLANRAQNGSKHKQATLQNNTRMPEGTVTEDLQKNSQIVL